VKLERNWRRIETVMRTRTRVALSVGFVIAFVAHAAVAQEVQWLEYRSGAGLQSMGPVGQKALQLSSRRPPGVNLPEFESKSPLFARWSSPMVPDGYLLIALDRSSEPGPYDRLFIDSDWDGHLADETAITAHQTGGNSAMFGPVTVVLMGETDFFVDYHLRLACVTQEGSNRLYTYAGGRYEGTISVGGEQRRFVLIDFNVNGSFGDRPLEMNFNDCDLIQIGSQGSEQIELVGKYLKVDDELYEMEVARDGAYIALAEAENVVFGTVTLPQETTEFTAGGENGSFTMHPANGRTQLPVGKYQVNHWTIERTDDEGTRWELQGVGFGNKGYFDVTEDAATNLSIGEPVVLAANATEANSTYRLDQPRLKGTFDETMTILRNGSPGRPPRLHIESKDGSYDRILSFEYG
jgi:hypothetical protein